MIHRIRTPLLVAVVSLVVWLYAEAESLSRVERESGVTLAAAGGESTVRAVDPEWRGAVRLKLEGSTASIARAPRDFTLTVGDPGVPAAPGEHVVNLRSALSANSEMARTGLAILSVEPPTLRIRVVTLTRLPDVAVRAEVSGIALAGEPVIAPGRASIVGPQETIERLSSMLGGATVIARVPTQTAAATEEGKPTTLTVRSALPPGFDDTDVTITPFEVNVTITRGAAATWSAPPPAVRVLIPPSEAARWSIEPAPDQRFVRGVVVTGPPAQVERFRSGELGVVAVLSFTPEDLANQVGAKDLAFLAEREGAVVALPAGVAVTAPERLVRVTISPAPPTPADPAP